jgi:hypothetical protein
MKSGKNKHILETFDISYSFAISGSSFCSIDSLIDVLILFMNIDSVTVCIVKNHAGFVKFIESFSAEHHGSTKVCQWRTAKFH